MDTLESAIISTIAEAILLVGSSGEIVHFNSHAVALFGYPEDELRGRAVEMLIPPRFRAQHAGLRATFGRETKTRMMGTNRDLYGLRKDGSEFPVEVGLGPLRQDNEQYVVVSIADVTTRKQHESQARWCEAIVKASDDAIISLTLDGIVTSWNPKAQAMFGYAADEMIGRAKQALAPEDRKDEFSAIIGRIRHGEAVCSYETVRQRKDGSPVMVSVTVAPIRDDAGRVVGVSATMRDITAIKQAERELIEVSAERAKLLRERTADLRLTEDLLWERTAELRTTLNRQAEELRRQVEDERRRVSQELHDEIGQMLTALNLNLELVRRNSSDVDMAAPLNNALQISADIVTSVRRIIHQLRPPQLDELGLVAALRWYLDGVRRTSYLAVELTGDLGLQRLPEDMEMGCFRIVQESVTNVLRHASAQRVEVSLSHDSRHLELTVRDDGVGFDTTESGTRTRQVGHLGLQGMRERARGLGGRLHVFSVSGQGCTIKLVIPLDPAQGKPQ